MSMDGVARSALNAIGSGESRGRITTDEAKQIVQAAEEDGTVEGAELELIQELYNSGMEQMRARDASPDGYDIGSNAQGVFLKFFERQKAAGQDPVLGAEPAPELEPAAG